MGWKGERDWIKVIKINQDFEDCLNASKDRLSDKYNEKWLKKYHSLYFSIKNEGFKETDSPIMAIKFGDGHYYRMDGTHRSSVLYDLGKKEIKALVFDFGGSKSCLSTWIRFIKWILGNYQNYQKIDESGESRVKDRYENILEITKDFWEAKSIGDVGCNAGYLSIMLGNSGASSVRGFDISELDIAAAGFIPKEIARIQKLSLSTGPRCQQSKSNARMRSPLLPEKHIPPRAGC